MTLKSELLISLINKILGLHNDYIYKVIHKANVSKINNSQGWKVSILRLSTLITMRI